jgi:hypothetical protein
VTAPETASPAGRAPRNVRLAVLVFLAFVLVAAVWLDATAGEPAHDRVESVTRFGPRVPAADALSTAWYCAEGTSIPDGRADETVVVANVGDRRAVASVTVMPGGNAAPKTSSVAVGPRAVARVRVADILASPDPGVVVEVSGSPAIVEHELVGNGDDAVGPCARETSSEWSFAAGTTVRGAQQWIALFNPFADDAIVDVTFLTDQGVREPDAFSGLVVPRHSRIAIPVHDRVSRMNVVASIVRTRRGRVVAEQSSILDGTDGRKGLALSLGAQEAARHWRFASGYATQGRGQALVIANPSRDATQVRVETHLDGAATLEPQTIPIGPRSVVSVDAAARVPANTGFWTSVDVTAGADVVAEESVSTRSPIASARRGYATTVGIDATARRWVLAPGRVGGSSADYLAVVNPGRKTVRVDVELLTKGSRTRPQRTRNLAIRAGRRVSIDLGGLGAERDTAVVVRAGGPVLVDREGQGGPGLTVAAAVPDFGADG